jgi:hypothetical protein
VTLYRLVCTTTALVDAAEFFADRGSHGLEGTGLFACRRRADGWWVTDRFVAPDQDARRVGEGCWVEVTEVGKRQLATSLGAGELYLARIHSHPSDAFHSRTDDRNPVLTFEGALSIVVPFFGLGLRRGLDACAVYRLLGGRWQPIDAELSDWLRVSEGGTDG